MNTAYRLIWDDLREMLVIVDENSSARGKKSEGRVRRAALPALVFSVALAGALVAPLGGGEAWGDSAVCVNYITGGTTGTTPMGTPSGTNSVACGDGATTPSSYSQSDAQTMAYNYWSPIIKNDAAFASVTAVQNATTYSALNNALNTLANDSTSEAKDVAKAYKSKLNNTYTDRYNQGKYAIAVGYQAQAQAQNAIAVGQGGQGGTISRQVRRPGTADDSNANKLNTSTPTGAYGSYDIAIGKAAAYGNRVSAPTGNFTNDDTDIGGYYYATGGEGGAIAMGKNTLAVRQHAIAVGTEALAGGQDAIAVGRNARALTPNSVVIGGGDAGSVGIQGRGAINTPLDSPAKGGNSIAIGNANNFTYGYKNTDDYYANTKNSIAIGYKAHTHAANAFAIGVSTDATAERSFAIGTTATNNSAAHQGTRAGGQGSLAFGDTAVVLAPKPDGFDTGAYERAADTRTNDAIAVGTNTLAQARNAVVVGGGMSYTYHDVSSDGKTMTNKTKYYNGSNWVDRAEGTGAKVGTGADGAVAIGGASGTVTGMDNTYFPKTPDSGLTVTNYTDAARATVAKSVALGTGSVANREAMKPISGTAPAYATSGYDVTTGKAYAGTGKDSPTWKSTLGAFSVGEETNTALNTATGNIVSTAVNTRQITGVAAGSADTDAVNVAQLKVLRMGLEGEVEHIRDFGLQVGANSSPTGTDMANQRLAHNLFSVRGGEGQEVENTILTTPAPADYSARNLTTRLATGGSGDNTVYVMMSENPTFGRGHNKVTISGDNGSVTTTNGGQKTVVNPQGVTISGTGSYQPIVIQQGNVSMGGNRIRNVAPGVDDTDAVNVSQLKKQHINISDGRNTSGVFGGDTINFRGDRNIHVNVDGLDIHITLDPDLNVRSVTTGRSRMDNDGFHIQNGPSVTANGIDAAGMRITNVADGIHPYDAVNRGQLDALDNRLSNRIDKAYGGIATVAASVGVPQTTVPGSNMLGAALGGFEGETALAVGYSVMSDNGHWILKNVLSASSEEFTWTTGLGYQW